MAARASVSGRHHKQARILKAAKAATMAVFESGVA